MSVIIINEVSGGESSQISLILSAKQTSRASLTLSVTGITALALTAKTISRASLALAVKPPFDGGFDLQARSVSRGMLNLRILRQENHKLVVTFRINPRTRAAGRHKDLHKFSVNDVEVSISDYTVDFPENSAGCVVQLTLSKFADRSMITKDAVYKFELAKRISGVWHWRTIIDTGELQSSNLLIGFAEKNKTDRFSLSTFEPVGNRLGKSPLRDLVVYDGFRVAPEELSSEIEYDTEGNEITVETRNIPGLTLYKLFDEIFKTRCGFPSWKTNIPDSSIKRADFSLGASYMSGIAPHCGNFEPDFSMSGEVLWIRDTTNLLPEGFPKPAALTVDDYEQVEMSEQIDRLDAFRLIFNEDKDDWDYFQTVEDTLPVSVTGSLFDENYSKVTLKRTIRKYYRNSSPGVVVKEDLIKEVRTTAGTFETKGVVTEEFKYDNFGRQVESKKKTETMVPGVGIYFETNSLETVEEETTKIIYGAHPFEPSKQVQVKVVSEKKGQISVDAENPYRGKDFKQAMVVADKSGNVRESSTIEYGPTEKTTKTLEILSNRQVRVNVVREDLINDRIDYDFSEVVYGEIGAQVSGRTRNVTVFETPGAGFTGHGREDLPIGELPLNIGIPLARRKLKKRRGGGGDLDLGLNGLELYMDRGLTYTVKDREDGELGVFAVRGCRFSGSSLGTRAQAHKTVFRGSKV